MNSLKSFRFKRDRLLGEFCSHMKSILSNSLNKSRFDSNSFDSKPFEANGLIQTFQFETFKRVWNSAV